MLLNWAIIAEKEIDRFEIERSINNYSFSKIATLTEPVTLQVLQQSFSATDDITHVNSNIIYYRLKVIGKAGAIKYSNIVIIKKSNEADLVLSPNPANYVFTISFYAIKDSEAAIWLFDNAGKNVLYKKQKVFKGFNDIAITDLNRYSNGIYDLKISYNDKTIVKKLMIRK